MAISFWHYYFISIALVFSVLCYGCYTREQFYPIILFLVTSKVSFVVFGNLVLASTFVFGKLGMKVFFGNLRDVEWELIYDRSKYSITETCLALTVFRQELSPTVFVFFGALIFVKIFHWLARFRLDHMEQVIRITRWTHVSLTILLTLLLAIDATVCYYCVQIVMSKGKTVMILFAFEFGVLIISALNSSMRYIVQVIDNRLESGLHYKGLFIMLLDLTSDGIKFATYVGFFSVVFMHYGLPIHIIR